MFLVVQTDAAASDRVVEDGVFVGSGLAVDFRRFDCPGEDEVIACCAVADAVIPAYAPLTARVLGELERCRIAAFMSTGFNSVDLAAATELGIVVTHVPDYCTPEVADHTLGLLLDLGRGITRLHDTVRAGAWDYEAAGKPGRLSDQRLGIVGLGRIGRAVAARARAFGLRVVGGGSLRGCRDHGGVRRRQGRPGRGPRLRLRVAALRADGRDPAASSMPPRSPG